MSLNSDLFAGIRAKPKGNVKSSNCKCEWEGCNANAEHRAPKKGGNNCEYWRFCLAHVQEYNKSYDYFTSLSEEAIRSIQTGGTATQKKRTQNGQGSNFHPQGATCHNGAEFEDSILISGRKSLKRGLKYQSTGSATTRSRLGSVEIHSLQIMNLAVDATPELIRARYKELVKRYHPDVNGGDRSMETKLQETMKAYDYLKSVGLC